MFDDDEFMELCGVDVSSMQNVKEESHVTLEGLLRDAERAVLETKTNVLEYLLEKLRKEQSTANDTLNDNEKMEQRASFERQKNVFEMAILITKGRYGDVLRLEKIQQKVFHSTLREVQDDQKHICSVLFGDLASKLKNENKKTQILLAYEILFVGIAFFNLYVQANYTGPAFEEENIADLVTLCHTLFYGTTKASSSIEMKRFHSDVLVALQVDGDFPFTICEYPEFLLFGRVFLHFVGNASHLNWSTSLEEIDTKRSNTSVITTESNNVTYLRHVDKEVEQVTRKKMISATWWLGRSSVAHQRLLMSKESSHTLWYETKDAFYDTFKHKDIWCSSNGQYKEQEQEQEEEEPSSYLFARAHVEWGLAQYHFDKNKQGKRSFEEAQEISGIQVQLSGSLGKRTKFQQKSLAQMVLFAASKYPPPKKKNNDQSNSLSKYAQAEAEKTHIDFGGKKKSKNDKNDKNDPKEVSVEETVERMIEKGKVVYRTIALDQADPDNILLEQINFDQSKLTEQGNLQIMDQIILLSLCLDVKNSNPNDGLTHEEMMPYITRVLENPNNWMVYSTGLLERAWLECESNKKRERAVLQMQALVDQHTTRLTITQASLKAIEDSAPANERMEFIHALAFPPRNALKRDLAEKYFALGVFGSACEIFKELEMWDDVVKCYQILDKPNKAEKLVRERLVIQPTPYMWCCLGDLTNDLNHYETAWILSKKRFARAKRSLGKNAFEKGNFKEAIQHLEESVEVAPMHTGAWFTLGVIGMRLHEWNLSLHAFTRVVQLEPENGEAWGNIGSIHLNNKRYHEAFSVLQEALKQKRHLWQMWENYALCAMETEKFGEAIYAMHILLDLRNKHKRPVDYEILAWLVEALVYPQEFQKKIMQQNDLSAKEQETFLLALGKNQEDEDFDDDLLTLEEASIVSDHTPPISSVNYKKQLAMLLGRITSIVTNDAKIWQVYAHFNDGIGRFEKALDCRLKQCRALQKAGWENDPNQVEEISKAAKRLAQDYIKQGTKKSFYSCRLYLRGILKKALPDFEHLKEVQELQATLEEINQLEKELPITT